MIRVYLRVGVYAHSASSTSECVWAKNHAHLRKRYLDCSSLLEHTQGCHSFARRDRGERRGANEYALPRCRKHLDVLSVDIKGTRQRLPLCASLAEVRQREEKTTAFGADAEEIPHHVIDFRRNTCSLDHA